MKSKKMKNENIYPTEDFYLDVFLIYKGLQIIYIDRENPKRCKFVFADNPNREKLVQSYNFAIPDSKEILIDVRKLILAIKDLKNKLYAEK